MNSFKHLAPALRLFQGGDCLDHLEREMERVKCRRALIVCGSSLARHHTALGLVRKALGDRYVGVFSAVQPHSPLESVQEAAALLRRVDADAVVVIGGGSAIVTARAAAILLAEGMDAHQLCTRRAADGRMKSPPLLAAKLPQFVIPTTPTTACVKAGSAVFDPATDQRLAMFDPKTRAQALFVHPELVGTAPRELVLSASLNTFAMAVEGLESASGDPLSDANLMHVLRLLAHHLPLKEGIEDTTARVNLVLAALLCGQGTDFTGGGIASVLGHAVGARSHIQNGIANALLLPHTMRFNALATTSRAVKIAAALGAKSEGGAVESAIAAVVAFLSMLPIPHRLRDVGVAREALPGIAEHAMNDWFIQSNPRQINGPQDLLEVLRSAW